jgi:cytochrome P450
MEYLKVLAAIRAVTGDRSEMAFPPRDPVLLLSRSEAGEGGVIFVHDARLSRLILQSSRYQQFNFLERILAVSDPMAFRWIRRFCDVGLIMVDGEEHRVRRQAMAQAMEQCRQHLGRLDVTGVVHQIALMAAEGGMTSYQLAQLITQRIFSHCVACLADLGNDLRLSGDDLTMIDFFNPFPTRSTLSVCEAALERCSLMCGMDSLPVDIQTAIISLLVMGVRPIQALFTVAINECSKSLRFGQSLEQALAGLDAIDPSSVVPTNFIMRECVADDDVEGCSIRAGDILYIFLGSASGCPFASGDAVPFGGGVHYCSGAKLTGDMLRFLRVVLAQMADGLLQIEPSGVRHGSATAFLAFQS